MRVAGYELHRRQAVQRFVDSLVVDPVDVFDFAPGDLLAMDQISLVGVIEWFGEGIVLSVALGSSRGRNLGFIESIGVANR